MELFMVGHVGPRVVLTLHLRRVVPRGRLLGHESSPYSYTELTAPPRSPACRAGWPRPWGCRLPGRRPTCGPPTSPRPPRRDGRAAGALPPAPASTLPRPPAARA